MFIVFNLLCILQLLSLKKPWTLIIDDALAGSFISPAADSFEEDHKLVGKIFS